MKRYVFWYHYNKPASQAAGSPRLTVHWRGQCHIASGIVCHPSTQSRIRKSQPRVVIAGRAVDVSIDPKTGVATVV
jgi:hypothetical protein